jgi:Asp-tRNA(Asn)/Glu-tRNA(Gln) amidotransferase A subunit family amidase
VVELLEEMQADKLTSEQIVLAFIKRLRTKGLEYNAILEDCFDDALAEARKCDETRKTGEAIGLLHGIPLSIKDGITVRNMSSCDGWGKQAYNYQYDDSVFIKALRA